MSSCFQRWFLQHPQDVGENYFTHAGAALWIGTKLIFYGSMEFAHAIIPGFDYFRDITDTTSADTLRTLADRIDQRQHED